MKRNVFVLDVVQAGVQEFHGAYCGNGGKKKGVEPNALLSLTAVTSQSKWGVVWAWKIIFTFNYVHANDSLPFFFH